MSADHPREEFDRMVARHREEIELERERLRPERQAFEAKYRKRRPPKRGLEGGEPAPVKPTPKPTPLADGAEAPIE